MKKLLTSVCLLALVLVCVFVLPANAEAASVSDLTFKINDYMSYSVTGCASSASGALEIPATYNGKRVTTIGNGAFYNCDSLTSVTIPDSVTTIGRYAFCYSDSLTSITIPNSVITIGEDAFYSCDSLTDVYITDPNAWCNIQFESIGSNLMHYADNLHVLDCDGNEVTEIVLDNSVTKIPSNAFYSCDSLTSVTIGNSVTSIGMYAFRYCDSLTSATIPDSVTTIGDGAFYNCDSLTTVTIGNSVTTIGSSVFNECTSLTSVIIGNSVTTIGGGAFSDCSRLTSITIPDSVTSIGMYAFRYCDSLTSITIPDSVTTIGKYAFSDCTSLTSVTIGNGVTSIGSFAFYSCPSLTSVAIPDSVTTIGEYVFAECTSLTHMVYAGSATAWHRIADNTGNGNLVYATKFHYETTLEYVDTCTETVLYCPRCKTGVAQIAKPEGAHSYAAETCTNPKICTVCGVTEGAALGHNYAAATCTSPKICTVCGATEGVALGHSSDVWFDLVLPTCTADGIQARICDDCGATETRVLAATGHSTTSVVTPPTCEEKGYTTNTCAVCGEVTVDYENALGHSFTNYKSNNDATCTEDGTQTAKCDRCTETRTRADQGSAKGHGWSAWLQTIAPTCTTDGIQARTCADCGATETRALAATGHSTTSVVTPPTCEEKGYTTTTCANCGEVTVTDYVDAKGHRWSAWIQTVAPNCKAEGAQVRFCNCGVRETEPLPKLPHSFENEICTVCGCKTAELQITSVTLRPEAAGLYFTGSFDIAETVSVLRKGIVVSVYNELPVADGTDPRSLWTETSTSVLVYNILSDHAGTASNSKRASLAIYARAYVELADGTYIYSDAVSVNLQQVTEQADALWSTLDALQKESITAMYKKFKSVLEAWNVPNLKRNRQ